MSERELYTNKLKMEQSSRRPSRCVLRADDSVVRTLEEKSQNLVKDATLERSVTSK